jgi:hypothetical protein
LSPSRAGPKQPRDHGAWFSLVTTDVRFTNGLLWTVKGFQRGDLSVVDGRISSLDIGGTCSDGAVSQTIDLEGGALLPGFVDGHVHPMIGGLEAVFVPIRDLQTPTAVVEAVGQWAKDHPDEEWIIGGGYNPAITADGCFESRWLDAVVADRPVVLRADDYHTVWCNSEALRRAGIDRDTPEPHDGVIVRREDGEAMGTLREWGANRLVLDLVPLPSLEVRLAALERGLATLAGTGVTSIQDAWVDPCDVDVYVAAAEVGTLRVRVNLALRAEPREWQAQREPFLAQRRRVEGLADGKLSARTIKFFIDGCIEEGTADLLSPYIDCPHSHGLPNWDVEDLIGALRVFDGDGFQVHIHAIGDAGVRNALDAIEAMVSLNRPRDRRPVIAHAQLVAPEDVARFVKIGVIANFQPYWAQLNPLQTVLTIPRLGPERGNLQFPISSILRSGGTVSFGSDWPCGFYPPLAGISKAITRKLESTSRAWVPDECLSLDQALLAYTRGASYQLFAEHERGSLEVGQWADLVHLAIDPSTVAPEQLNEIEIVGTWVAGQAVHGNC